jgi:hypothetical protein
MVPSSWVIAVIISGDVEELINKKSLKELEEQTRESMELYKWNLMGDSVERLEDQNSKKNMNSRPGPGGSCL